MDYETMRKNREEVKRIQTDTILTVAWLFVSLIIVTVGFIFYYLVESNIWFLTAVFIGLVSIVLALSMMNKIHQRWIDIRIYILSLECLLLEDIYNKKDKRKDDK